MAESDGSTESKQIRLVVDEELVAKWDDYWEGEDEYSSRADLIRTAVAHEMADSVPSSRGPGTDDLSIQMAKVMERMEDLSQRTESIESDIRFLKTQARKDPEAGKLATKIFRHLPSEEPGTDEWKVELADRENTLEAASMDKEPAPDLAESKRRVKAWHASVQDLAVALGEPEFRVQEAVGKLLTDTHAVREVEYDGKTRYWKEV